jgi:hypothetical protein
MDLTNPLAEEWNCYRQSLKESGISLTVNQDELIWIGGDKSGNISTNNIYEAFSNILWITKLGGWRRNLWKWECGLKIKIFSWLIEENKTLSWKNLQKHGWKAPGMCNLCKKDRESTKHLFLNCPFTRLVWYELKKVLNLDTGWNGNTLVDLFRNWSIQNFNLITLPAFVCWYIWIDRNKSIFEYLRSSVQRIVFLSRSALDFTLNIHKDYTPQNLVPSLPADKYLAWLDGVTQQNGLISGVGGVLKLIDFREYRWTLNCGKVTNTRAEIMGAWDTLALAVRMSVFYLHILGDSKTVIVWLNKKGDLRVANLYAWKDIIVETCHLFRSITFEHI